VAAVGLEGHSGDDGRDLTVDAMNEAAKRLTQKYPAEVSAVRYLDGRYEVDGFVIWTGPVATGHGTEWHGPVLHVPVRRRLRLGRLRRGWRATQSVPSAAAEVGRLLSPDPI
jgi:hypothetical protein